MYSLWTANIIWLFSFTLSDCLSTHIPEISSSLSTSNFCVSLECDVTCYSLHHLYMMGQYRIHLGWVKGPCDKPGAVIQWERQHIMDSHGLYDWYSQPTLRVLHNSYSSWRRPTLRFFLIWYSISHSGPSDDLQCIEWSIRLFVIWWGDHQASCSVSHINGKLWCAGL